MYDPEDDSWTVGAGVPTKRQHLSVTVVNDTVYAIGGRTYHFAFPDDSYGVSATEYATNERYTPIGYGSVAPAVVLVSPENQNYTAENVSLTFTVNKPVSWLGYSLDGQENVTITGNATLSGLAGGLHNVTVYAKDGFENTGASETVTFSVAAESESFQTNLVAVASGASAIVIAAGLLIYFKKFKKRE